MFKRHTITNAEIFTSINLEFQISYFYEKTLGKKYFIIQPD